MPDSALGSIAEHSQVQSNGFHDSTDTLPTVAGKINAYMEKAEQSAEKARQQRVSAGQLLIEARRRVDGGEAGDVTWSEWVRHNIQRSLRDCQRVMKIAGDPDPETALVKEREDARVGMAQSRERGDKRLSRSETDHSTAARDALAAMPEDQRIAFLADRIKELSFEARDKLLGTDAFSEAMLARVRDFHLRVEKSRQAAAVRTPDQPAAMMPGRKPEPSAQPRTESTCDVSLVTGYQAIPDLETQAGVYWWILGTTGARDPDADAPEREFILDTYRATPAAEQQKLRAYLAQLKTSPVQELAARKA
jgi:hypothetical protein